MKIILLIAGLAWLLSITYKKVDFTECYFCDNFPKGHDKSCPNYKPRFRTQHGLIHIRENWMTRLTQAFKYLLIASMFLGCGEGPQLVIQKQPTPDPIEKTPPVSQPTQPTTPETQVKDYSEFWLVSGQSNIARETLWEGDYEDVFAWNRIYDANDKTELNWYFSTVAGHFALEMKTETNTVGVVAVTEGGTEISEWSVGGYYYETYISKLEGLPFDGVVWWQGETDSIYGNLDYGDDLIAMINQWRDLFGASVPFYIIELENFAPCLNYVDVDDCEEPQWWDDTRKEQLKALTLENVYIIPTTDITHGHVHPLYAYSEIARRAAEIAKENK